MDQIGAEQRDFWLEGYLAAENERKIWHMDEKYTEVQL
jgi:hypothetical protein